MDFLLLFLLLLVEIKYHPCLSRPTGDCAIETSDQLIHDTAPFIRIANTTIPEMDDDKSGKLLVPKDVELVPPYDSNAGRRGKNIAGSIVGAALEVRR